MHIIKVEYIFGFPFGYCFSEFSQVVVLLQGYLSRKSQNMKHVEFFQLLVVFIQLNRKMSTFELPEVIIVVFYFGPIAGLILNGDIISVSFITLKYCPLIFSWHNYQRRYSTLSSRHNEHNALSLRQELSKQSGFFSIFETDISFRY